MVNPSHLKSCVFIIVIATTLMACSGKPVSESSISSDHSSSHDSNSSRLAHSSAQGSSASACPTDVTAIFERNNCLACHNGSIFQAQGGGLNLETGNIGQRLLNLPTTHGGTGCAEQRLIDADDRDHSLLLNLIDPERFKALQATSCQRLPMPQTGNFMPEEDIRCVEQWLDDVIETQAPIEPPVASIPFDPANNLSALSKAKYILHGGRVTNEDIAALGDLNGPLKRERLKVLINQWQETAQY